MNSFLGQEPATVGFTPGEFLVAKPRSVDGSSSSSREEPTPPRLVLIGDKAVGTSSLMNRYNRGLYNDDYRPEKDKVMRHTKCVHLPRADCHVTVQFWDVEGGNTKAALASVQRSHACAVVYDVTNRSSFEYAQYLLDNINPRLSSLLIGNKSDLKDCRKVSMLEGKLLARIHKVRFIETSAKAPTNVDEAVQLFIQSVPNEYMNVKGQRQRHDSAGAGEERMRKWKSTGSVCSVCSNKLRAHHHHPGRIEERSTGRKYRFNSD